MHDDDDALAGIDLAAWQPPPPPAGTADAVIARMREPAAASAIDPEDRPSRRAFWLGSLALVTAAVVALTVWGVTRAARGGRGELIALRARHLELDGSGADLDAGARVRWQRDGHRITAHQARGTVRWTIAGEDTLVIDSGEPGSAATIEASGASLRMEVQMNVSDMRLLGASALTAAAVSVVTVVVYMGHVKATSGGQTVNVTPGAAVELRPERPPQEPAELRPEEPPRQPAEPIAVGAATADIHALEDKLRAADEQIARLTAELAARPASHGPSPAPARKAPSPPAPEVHDDSPPAPEVHDDSPATARSSCDQMSVDDVLAQAANQFSAGFPKSALALVKRSLQCRQNVKMYRMAAMYACAAHELATAKQMFSKLPSQFQPAILQRCQQEGLSLSSP